MCLQFWFVIFWQKDFGAKAAHKMLVKLTPDTLIFTSMECDISMGKLPALPAHFRQSREMD
jgi:hypothetical protein